ncbi:flagellar basal-body rod protein FlgG [Candidatus Liberibacter solanacearum]|uniref:Flagellar basal-body rod protein FlgG n=2 Tax=Candidatus Liberibacter solanacearum TaxID=556287 RepID=A0A1V2N8M1_9HYPH|nr:flagellar basal-body rod protein FlgG [Candidatus Liberibacter solanacearum]ADR51848.1 flagellar basal body rod protein FlgG [Candidatus Liberibacter solanacearum CLso-ZC1]ONI59792.1 flagellar basal-body rod protein FlgG [Candidatus Liberibacter solanacearum]ONI60021.1 flagellar basal-body rod protein FlgG [Candidatus Liberibacter solanacearum]RPD37691.1 flagellar basal-body rod protein FlgG [Candidatus Liberibacter solanacearum]
MKAFTIAAAGMSAQQTNLEIIANNIANINTTGYKRARAEFADFLYQAEKAAGSPSQSADQSVVPEGINIGSGVQISSVRNVYTQGELVHTGNSLDLALVGRGWFQVETPDKTVMYTRAGSFNIDSKGQLVTSDGNTLLPGITIPEEARELTVSRSGQIMAVTGKNSDFQPLGQLLIANFVNEAGLRNIGDNLVTRTSVSGEAIISSPDDAGFAHIKQGYLEASNVDAVKEISEMISAQRAYEMNSKVIQAADEMSSLVSKMR